MKSALKNLFCACIVVFCVMIVPLIAYLVVQP